MVQSQPWLLKGACVRGVASVQVLMLFPGTVPFLVSFALCLTFAVALIHLPRQNGTNKTCRREGIGTNHLYCEYVTPPAVDGVLNGTWVADIGPLY